uniref:Uncharacterized protein n=1 Tax=Helianthus annuus TaxID=4232 RepID=A0A251S3Y7_HELAN
MEKIPERRVDKPVAIRVEGRALKVMMGYFRMAIKHVQKNRTHFLKLPQYLNF